MKGAAIFLRIENTFFSHIDHIKMNGNVHILDLLKPSVSSPLLPFKYPLWPQGILCTYLCFYLNLPSFLPPSPTPHLLPKG